MNDYQDNKTKGAVGKFFVLLLAIIIVGCVLSPLYLLLGGIDGIPIFISAVAAVFLGFVVGYAAAKLIKVMKIKSFALSLLAVIIGFSCFSYFKWALYVSNDNSAVFDSYEDDLDFALEVMELIDDGLDDAYGITETPDFGYYLAYKDNNYKKADIIYYLTNPARTFDQIGRINGEGRWGFDSSSVSEPSNVTGVVLTIIWVLESFIILACMIIIVKTPFTNDETQQIIQTSAMDINTYQPYTEPAPSPEEQPKEGESNDTAE